MIRKEQIEKRVKKNKIREILEEMNDIEYNDSINYRDTTKKLRTKVKKDEYGFPTNLEELEKEETDIKLSQHEIDYDRHKLRTNRNLEKYFEQFFLINNRSKHIIVYMNQ